MVLILAVRIGGRIYHIFSTMNIDGKIHIEMAVVELCMTPVAKVTIDFVAKIAS